MVEGVWLTPKYFSVALKHDRKGNVYAYEVPVGVLHRAGRTQRKDWATEVFIPAKLWHKVKFLGKKMSARDLAEKIRDVGNVLTDLLFLFGLLIRIHRRPSELRSSCV